MLRRLRSQCGKFIAPFFICVRASFMKITVLGSGSTGNAVLIVAGNTRVLVDAGLRAKEITRRFALMGEDIQSLDGVLITHEHGDHAGGLRVLLGTVDCPVYISAQTH